MDPRRATGNSGTGAGDQPLSQVAATGGRRTSIVTVRDTATLSGFVPAWEYLADSAIEPNVFYEHWMLLPALEAFGAEKDICVVLVLIHDPHDAHAPPKLGGLFPLERIRNFRNLKLPALSLWRHLHCYVCTPLLRADAAAECLDELFRWLQSGEERASLIELGSVYADGPFHQRLVDLSNELGLLSCATEVHTRGLWRKSDDASPESSVSGDLRRRLRRKERRLRERGRLEHVALRPDDDVARWIEEFLQIEASGWKGRSGTALACSESGRRYFRQTAASAFRRGR